MPIIVKSWALPIGQQPTPQDFQNMADNGCNFIKWMPGASPNGELNFAVTEESDPNWNPGDDEDPENPSE